MRLYYHFSCVWPHLFCHLPELPRLCQVYEICRIKSWTMISTVGLNMTKYLSAIKKGQDKVFKEVDTRKEELPSLQEEQRKLHLLYFGLNHSIKQLHDPSKHLFSTCLKMKMNCRSEAVFGMRGSKAVDLIAFSWFVVTFFFRRL